MVSWAGMPVACFRNVVSKPRESVGESHWFDHRMKCANNRLKDERECKMPGGRTSEDKRRRRQGLARNALAMDRRGVEQNVQTRPTPSTE